MRIRMPKKNFSQNERKSKLRGCFRLSKGSVVQGHGETRERAGEFEDTTTLPRTDTAPMLFIIARDPGTLFAYWNINWLSIFAKTEPVDRQVHLRVYRADGVQEKSVAVEPMGANCYVTVSQLGGSYHVEIGYYQPADVWQSVAKSGEVILPPADFAAGQDVDLATIPLHLSFQYLLDLFGTAGGSDLAKIISQFQTRAASAGGNERANVREKEILHAMDLSLSDIAPVNRVSANDALRQRVETFPGYGSGSPWRGFGENSWSSAGS